MNRTRQHPVRQGTSGCTFALIAVLMTAAACGNGTETATTAAVTPSPATTAAVTPSTTPPTSAAVTTTSTTEPPETTAVPDGGLSLEQATADIIGIVDAFSSGDLTYIDTLLGTDGMWVGISGDEWPGPQAATSLRPLLVGIQSTEILGEGTLVADGWAFPLREYRGGTIDYSIVVGRRADGTALVTEEWKVPEPLNPPASCTAPTPGTHDLSITVGGRDHAVRVVVPSAANGTVLPTVIDWHASGENAEVQAATSGYEALAEEHGFVVAHPEYSTPAYGNYDPQTLDATTDGDAIVYANTLIDELIANWCADPARIYSTGFSLGSLFTARLACVLSERVAAVVSVAGIFHTDDCNPERAVPYLAFHGTADPVFPFDASLEARFGGDPTFLAQAPLDEFAEFAVGIGGCEPISVESQPETAVIRHDYAGCDDGTYRTFYQIVGGGHTWPGSISQAARWEAMGIGETTDEIDATKVSWEFMKHHHLP